MKVQKNRERYDYETVKELLKKYMTAILTIALKRLIGIIPAKKHKNKSMLLLILALFFLISLYF